MAVWHFSVPTDCPRSLSSKHVSCIAQNPYPFYHLHPPQWARRSLLLERSLSQDRGQDRLERGDRETLSWQRSEVYDDVQGMQM